MSGVVSGMQRCELTVFRRIGDPEAGTSVEFDPTHQYVRISKADRAGAWVLTVMMIALMLYVDCNALRL